jgi:hypothetical protein
MCRWSPLLTIAVCVVLGGCKDSPTTPTPPPGGLAGYAGEWGGTTSQGRPLSFTVSADQKVTAITVDYNFNGCAGVKTFSNLSLDIARPTNPNAPVAGPGFGYGTGPPEGGDFTQVVGFFAPNGTVTGSVVFVEYGSCGNAVAIWTATRR